MSVVYAWPLVPEAISTTEICIAYEKPAVDDL